MTLLTRFAFGVAFFIRGDCFRLYLTLKVCDGCKENRPGRHGSVFGTQLIKTSTLYPILPAHLCSTFKPRLPQAGSFGTREDVVFYLASRLAREKGLPRCALDDGMGMGVQLLCRLI